MKEVTGQTRVVIEEIKPEIDDGRFPIKRVIAEKVVVEADIFADGHDVISALLL
jgi:starch synthase (maltosyl-transferring)